MTQRSSTTSRSAIAHHISPVYGRVGRSVAVVLVGVAMLVAPAAGGRVGAQSGELSVTISISNQEFSEKPGGNARILVELSAPNTTGATINVRLVVEGPGGSKISIVPSRAVIDVGDQSATLIVKSIDNSVVDFDGGGLIFIDDRSLPDGVRVGNPGSVGFFVIDDEVPPSNAPTVTATELQRLPIPGQAGDDIGINDESFADIAHGVGGVSLEPDGSLSLDAVGNPVIVFDDISAAETALVHCNDNNCVGDDESRARVGERGFMSSLVLDAKWLPVIGSIKGLIEGVQIVRCNDPDCVGDDESEATLLQLPVVGAGLSLTLDSVGNPVMSFDFSPDSGGLRLARCNDPRCSGGDESIVNIAGAEAAKSAGSMALDIDGNPVVGFIQGDPASLHLVRCNDPACVGGDESVVQLDHVGGNTLYLSMVLDAQSNPVIAYSNTSRSEMRLMRCNDPNCVGDDESVVVLDAIGGVEGAPSLALDAGGLPVVAFYDDVDADLKLVRCADAGCLAGWVVVVDSDGRVGRSPSLALDARDHPVVAYLDVTNRSVKLVHCNDPICVATIADVAPSTTVTPRAPAPGIPTTVIDPGNGELPATGRSAHVSTMAAALLLSGLGLLLVARRRGGPQPSSW